MKAQNFLCCGLKLRKGSLIVGSFELLGNLIALLTSLWAWWSLADAFSEESQNLRNDKIDRNDTNLIPDFDDETITKSLIGLAFSTIIFAFGFISSIVLIFGVKLSSVGAIKTWIVVKVILVILLILHFSMCCKFLTSTPEALLAFIIGAIFTVCSIYFLTVIIVHTRELIKGKGSEGSKMFPFPGDTKGVKYETVQGA